MLVKFMLFRVLRTGGSIDESFNLIESIPPKKRTKENPTKSGFEDGLEWRGGGTKHVLPKNGLHMCGFLN